MKVTGVFDWTENDNYPPCTVWVGGCHLEPFWNIFT